MAGMTMIVCEIDGRDVMLSDAESIHSAMTNGTVKADTMVTVYLSDGAKHYKPAAQHTQLAPYFPMAIEPVTDERVPVDDEEMASTPKLTPQPTPQPAFQSTAERLRALEAEIEADPHAAANRAWVPPVQAARSLPTRFDAQRTNGHEFGDYPRSLSGKSRVNAAIFALLLGGLGAHKFYMGKNKAGGVMLAMMVFGAMTGVLFWVAPTIALIEGILYLTQSDEEFEDRYFNAPKDWF